MRTNNEHVPIEASYSFRIEKEDGSVLTEQTIPADLKLTVPELEYHGLIAGLKAVPKDCDLLHVHGDSKLIINQVTGAWETKKLSLRILRGEVRTLLSQSLKPQQYKLEWVPRKNNHVG